ncbi:MAG TPA: hypothetical protein PLI52_04335 [Prochlorococcaceae cyanobacterium AMR_MDS_5431]|nr:hypothetical protein [Prochlorococcaceae cyanobacterium AMR_MDS_5431]
MQILKLEFELDWLKAALTTILENRDLQAPEMDAGKWYRNRFNNNPNN